MIMSFKRFALIEEFDVDGNSETAYYDYVDHDSISFSDEQMDILLLNKLNKLDNQKKEVEQMLQDFEDRVYNYFLEHELELTSEMKQQAHLELGVEFEYD